MVKIAHHALEFTFRQLSMCHRNPRFRQQLGESIILVLDRIDFVVKIVSLATAFQFAHDSFNDDALRQRIHKRFDGEPPLRRGRDHRKVPQAFQRHGKRARNRRGGQR